MCAMLTMAFNTTFYKQIAALVLTLRIRKVKIKAVNDSKEIAMMVYFTTIAAVESLLLAGCTVQKWWVYSNEEKMQNI